MTDITFKGSLPRVNSLMHIKFTTRLKYFKTDLTFIPHVSGSVITVGSEVIHELKPFVKHLLTDVTLKHLFHTICAVVKS